MNAVLMQPASRATAALQAAIKHACDTIAPAWPLDRQIAVNPWWSFRDRPFAQVAADLGQTSGARLVWPHGAAGCGENASRGLPLTADVLDADPGRPRGPTWNEVITQQVSQFCASYFDEHQADWHRSSPGGLYAGWRESLPRDHALATLMRAPQVRARARQLPGEAEEAIGWALEQLQVEQADHATFLQACLWRIGGWASWCAYLGWEASLAGREDVNLRELLAIRACWEALLPDGLSTQESAGAMWRDSWRRARRDADTSSVREDIERQRARERAWQDHLVGLLQRRRDDAAGATLPARAPDTVLVFCIDVRSERLRRALESLDTSLATRGFAGFFGLPIRLAPLGTTQWRPLLPGLFAPTLDVTETCGDRARDDELSRTRQQRLRSGLARRRFTALPSGSFAGIETLGLARIGEILRRSFAFGRDDADAPGLSPAEKAALRPCVHIAGDDAVSRKADLVAASLRGMSLGRALPRLLVLVGHASQSANNPQAAALDCGACGGHGGETNASVLAEMLNDAAVRAELAARGIAIPDDMLAIAALHNTTTDEVTLLPGATVSDIHAPWLQELRQQLEQACDLTRRERAPSLGLATVADSSAALLRSLRHRARDWSQTRPEWGLAGNAAFIVAPRERTRGVNLDGRVFLHDYDATLDTDGSVLELIMTAPMVVTHWINMQYNASTVDPGRFGSGNKVLHNVACGRIGVFEGNTGDLRIGLARQSVHDGEKWMHEPLRLTVCIDAPRAAIERVIAKHELVRNLVDNEWLYLFRFGEQGMEWRHHGKWMAWPNPE